MIYFRQRSGQLRRYDGAIIPVDPANRDYAEFLAAVAADPSCVADEPAPPLTETACIAAIQAVLDRHAQAWGYDSIFTGSTYAVSRKPKWRAEGQALADWRDDVWDKGYEIMAEVQAGRRSITSIPDLLALLPAAPDRPSA